MKANVYGAALKVNGNDAADNTAYTLAPIFGEDGTYTFTLRAYYTEGQAEVTKTCTVKKVGAGDAITGTCGENAVWLFQTGSPVYLIMLLMCIPDPIQS